MLILTQPHTVLPRPDFLTRTGGCITRQAVDTMLRELARVANLNLPAEEHIQLHAHLLRHTALKEMAKRGRRCPLPCLPTKPQDAERDRTI